MKSYSRSKGQTALEMLLLLGVILTGLVVVISSSLPTQEGVTLSFEVRNAASDACTYLQMAVVVNDSIYAPLNNIIKSFNYTPIQCRLSSYSTDLSDDSVNIFVVFAYEGPNNNSVQLALERYLFLKLSTYRGFSVVNGSLYYGGKPVELEVRTG